LGKLAAFVDKFCVRYLTPVDPLEFEDWLASCLSYNENRKEQLRQSARELYGQFPSKKMCQKVQSFVKTESYLQLKHARMINSRSDHFKAWSGPYFKAMEQEVYKLHWFIKHVPVKDRPAKVKALRASGRLYYQTDYTAFESHFTPQILKAVECRVYKYLLRNHPRAARLIEQTLTGPNRMRTRTGVSCTVNGRRMSGDMCTSLGNGLTNLLLVKFIVEELKGGFFDGFVEGDDGLFASSVPLCIKDFFDLGFTIKINEDGPISDPCHASFCGMVFADSGEIIKDPKKFLSEFGWTSSFISGSAVLMDRLLRAKALSACYETPQCPILGAMSREALRRTRGVRPLFVEDGYHHTPKDEAPIPEFSPSMDTRLLFELKYGVSVGTQLLAEQLIKKGHIAELSHLLTPHPDMEWYSINYVSPAG